MKFYGLMCLYANMILWIAMESSIINIIIEHQSQKTGLQYLKISYLVNYENLNYLK